jgi:hypothetical protein
MIKSGLTLVEILDYKEAMGYTNPNNRKNRRRRRKLSERKLKAMGLEKLNKGKKDEPKSN